MTFDGTEVEPTGEPEAPRSVAWSATELPRRMLLALAGALPALIVSWVFRVKILQFLVFPTLYALASDLQVQSGLPTPSYPELLVHPDWSSPWMFWKAALAGGLVLSAPWTAYQAFGYAARRAKPGGAGRIGAFVMASTAVVWGSAWLVPNLLVPALQPQPILPLIYLPWDPNAYPRMAFSGLVRSVFGMLLTVCVVALVPIVVAFVISATRASWGQLLRFGGLRVLLVSVGMATVFSPWGLPLMWWLCGLGSVYYASVAVAYLIARGRTPESSQ